MFVNVFKMEITGIECSNKNCKHLPEYTVNIIGHVYHIKTDTTCASFNIDGNMAIYCRDCIDEIYHDLKSKLDTKLWAFK